MTRQSSTLVPPMQHQNSHGTRTRASIDDGQADECRGSIFSVSIPSDEPHHITIIHMLAAFKCVALQPSMLCALPHAMQYCEHERTALTRQAPPAAHAGLSDTVTNGQHLSPNQWALCAVNASLAVCHCAAGSCLTGELMRQADWAFTGP